MNTGDFSATSRSQVSLTLKNMSTCTGWVDTKFGTDVQAHADFSSNADSRLTVCGFEGNVLVHVHVPLRMNCTKFDCGTIIRSNYNSVQYFVLWSNILKISLLPNHCCLGWMQQESPCITVSGELVLHVRRRALVLKWLSPCKRKGESY